MPNAKISVRGARPDDVEAVLQLLTAARLPHDGVAEQFGPGYAVAESDGAIVGAEGVEQYEDAGLLRSAVVLDTWRGHGVGEMLTRDRLAWARAAGISELWLLTTTAADYFPRFGFARANRADAPDAVQASREFAEACPASAVAMRLSLTPDDPVSR